MIHMINLRPWCPDMYTLYIWCHLFLASLLSAVPHRAWWPVWGTCSWSRTSSAAAARSWTGWRAGLMACIRLQNTCSLQPVTDVWGPPRCLETDGEKQSTPECFRQPCGSLCGFNVCACLAVYHRRQRHLWSPSRLLSEPLQSHRC